MPTGERIYQQYKGHIIEMSSPESFRMLDRVIDFVRIESIKKHYGVAGGSQKGERILESWKKHFDKLGVPYLITENPSVKGLLGRILWKEQLVDYK